MVIFLAFGAIAATLLSLMAGLFAFLKGGVFSQKYGNRLMQMRVLMQGIAVFLLFLLFWMGKK